MLNFGFYNMDCMEGMKQFPDKYFDLAIVDPPYGDGGGSGNGKTRADSAEHSTSIARAGFHGKTYSMGGASSIGIASVRGSTSTSCQNRRNMGEQVRQKNHYVGHSPETGIFR